MVMEKFLNTLRPKQISSSLQNFENEKAWKTKKKTNIPKDTMFFNFQEKRSWPYNSRKRTKASDSMAPFLFITLIH